MAYGLWPMALYFITGATGFLGGEVVRQLIAGGHRVRALVRSPDAASALAAAGAELHEGDITHPESMRAPMTGADGVFHIAGWYKVGVLDRSPAVDINVNGTRNVLTLMRELGVPKGVYTSTLAVNSDTHGQVVDETYRFTGKYLSVYDETKAQAHHLADQFIAGGLPLVIVQPGVIYGPGDTSSVRLTLRQYLQRKLPVVPKKTAFCWGYIEDVARGHLLAMEQGRPGRNYFLAGPVHTMIEALDIAQSITHIPAPRIRVNLGAMLALVGTVAKIEPYLPAAAQAAFENLRVVGGATYLGSNARAVRELGWRVRPLADGLRATLRAEMLDLGMTPDF